MSRSLCPGQDTRHWRPEDIFDVICPGCGGPVEFFKDEATRRCRGCGRTVFNPRLGQGCAQWCEHASECLGLGPVAPAGTGGKGSPGDETRRASKADEGGDR